MDFDNQDFPREQPVVQHKATSRGQQERIFSNEIEIELRQDFQYFIDPKSQIQIPYFSPAQYLPSFQHDHQIISQDPSIVNSFPTKQNRQEYKGNIEILEEVKIKGELQDIRAKVKSLEDELIFEMKQLHPYLSEKQMQQAEQNVVQFWRLHEVRPSAVGKILKQCVKTMLIYQTYHNSNNCATQRKGVLRELQQKYATILDFITETFSIENESLDKIIPLEKEYFVFKHLNFESFPDRQFHITQQAKKVRSKKKKQEAPFQKTTITSQSNEQRLASK